MELTIEDIKNIKEVIENCSSGCVACGNPVSNIWYDVASYPVFRGFFRCELHTPKEFHAGIKNYYKLDTKEMFVFRML